MALCQRPPRGPDRRALDHVQPDPTSCSSRTRERLWARITRDLTAYFSDLARRGALAGPPGEPTFYVKCDAETNPPELRETGQVVTEIGLQAPAPAEFIVIRIIHGPTGVEIVDPKSADHLKLPHGSSGQSAIGLQSD